MATEVRDIREVAYGCNFSFSLHHDTVCNFLCLRIQIFSSCFVSVSYYHLDFRNMQGIPHIGLCPCLMIVGENLTECTGVKSFNLTVLVSGM
jgi:hypothetical protein